MEYMDYFKEYAKDDTEDVITICETASKIIYERFKCKFYHPELLAVVFASTYDTILHQLKDYEKTMSDFEINIADRLIIGYSTTSNDEDEKQGNFQIYVRHLNSTKKNDDIAEEGSETTERAVTWTSTNIKAQPKIISEISGRAKEDLDKNFSIQIQSKDLIMPIFISVYESIIVYLTTKRREVDEFEYSINFINCFEIAARETEDDLDEITITPNVGNKLLLKDDAIATAKYE